jgi:hypothetical protein
MKRKPERYANRPFAVEYYVGLSHRNYFTRGFCTTEENAYVKAGEHLDRGHFVKAVIVKRKPGLVVCTRFKFGPHRFDQTGDLPAKGKDFSVDVSLPPLETNG